MHDARRSVLISIVTDRMQVWIKGITYKTGKQASPALLSSQKK